LEWNVLRVIKALMRTLFSIPGPYEFAEEHV
jgi:hypothetical protein